MYQIIASNNQDVFTESAIQGFFLLFFTYHNYFPFIERYFDLGGQNVSLQKVAICLIKAMQRWVKFAQLPNKNTRVVLLKLFRCFFMSSLKKFNM